MFIDHEEEEANDSCDHIWSISIYRLSRLSPQHNCKKYFRDGQTLICPDY